MARIHYRLHLKSLARELRTNATDAEVILWNRLRRKAIQNVQFFRQRPVGPFIVDFIAPSVRLVIEIDGGQHFAPEAARKDRQRDEHLERLGYSTLRFTDIDIMKNLDAVVEEIYRRIGEARKSPRTPL